jgi:hypothetical protein
MRELAIAFLLFLIHSTVIRLVVGPNFVVMGSRRSKPSMPVLIGFAA